MWFVFDNIEHRNDLKGQSGRIYSAYVVTGTRRGFNGDPDMPYQKVLFPNQSCTIIEHGIPRPGMSIVQFFEKAVTPGETLPLRVNVMESSGSGTLSQRWKRLCPHMNL